MKGKVIVSWPKSLEHPADSVQEQNSILRGLSRTGMSSGQWQAPVQTKPTSEVSLESSLDSNPYAEEEAGYIKGQLFISYRVEATITVNRDE